MRGYYCSVCRAEVELSHLQVWLAVEVRCPSCGAVFKSRDTKPSGALLPFRLGFRAAAGTRPEKETDMDEKMVEIAADIDNANAAELDESALPSDAMMYSVVDGSSIEKLERVAASLRNMLAFFEKDANGYDPELKRSFKTVLAGVHELKGRVAILVGRLERGRAEALRAEAGY